MASGARVCVCLPFAGTAQTLRFPLALLLGLQEKGGCLAGWFWPGRLAHAGL